MNQRRSRSSHLVNSLHSGLVCWVVLILATACASTPQLTPTENHPPNVSFVLTSQSFGSGETIPVSFTCDGADVSPELRWSEIPTSTRSLALIVDDPDAPGGTFVHWVLFDIPASAAKLAEAEKAIGTNGKNGFNQTQYRGPCPPPGKPHRYFFNLYALDVDSLNLQPGASKTDLLQAINNHVVGTAQLLGLYERK
jgi:Raf kinase inhibitor-like YbhB/YbcL family protein